MPLKLGNTFLSIQDAKDTIKTVLAEAQESWKAAHSDKTRFNIICKDVTCNFRIRVSQIKRNGVVEASSRSGYCRRSGDLGITVTG
jgi:hypothetical protein